MITINIPASEAFDEATNTFVTPFKGQKVTLEHSLVSISKWESRWHKSFFTQEAKTGEELLDYFYCMVITQNVSEYTIKHHLSGDNVKEIISYMEDSMTATVINERPNNRPNKQIVTSEVVYSWMIELGIPIEFQKWHINRLLMLIRVRNIRESQAMGGQKMSKGEIMRQNTKVNQARRKALNSKG